MRDRLKILDCDRKNILGLPAGALQVWLCRYMNEDDEKESWISLHEVEIQTGQDKKTIIKWQDYLVTHKWLVDTGKTAADKLLAMGRIPSKGSYQCKVYRVDDATSGKIPLKENSSEIDQKNQWRNSTGGNSPHKVYGYDSGSGFGSPPSQLGFTAVRVSSTTPCGAAGESQPPVTAKPEPTPKPTAAGKFLAKYGVTREEWDAHDRDWQNKRMVELGIILAQPESKTAEQITAERINTPGYLDELERDIMGEEYARPREETPKPEPKPKATSMQAFPEDDWPCSTPGCGHEGIRWAPNGQGLLCATCFGKTQQGVGA